MIVVGCTIEESQQAVSLAEQHAELYASIGIHPHTFNEFGILSLELWIGEMKKLVQESKTVIAIGECGLDYYSHDKQLTISDQRKASQKEGFSTQIKLAAELNLPLIVHCRSSSVKSDDAYRDLYEILLPITSHLKAFVLHCYQGDTEVTKKFLELPNIYFSFAGNVTYPTKKALIGTKDDLLGVVKMIPLERIFTETDCPFLAPQEKRGERNEPAYVMLTAQKMAELKNISLDELGQITEKSAKKVFGL